MFPMQPTQPPPGNPRLFAMPSNQEELHKANTPGPICHTASRTVLQPSTVSRSQPRAPVYSACSQGGAGGGTHGQTMQRGPARHDATAPQRIRAAPPCSAGQTMQIRPESRCTGLAESPYIQYAQRIARAVSGHFKRFSSFWSTPGSAARRNPDRPPGIDTLRLYAVGVEFS